MLNTQIQLRASSWATIFFLTFSSSFALDLAASPPGNFEYVGSQSCIECHNAEHELWLDSDHRKAMLPANADSVLGDFSDVTVEYHSVKSRLFKKGNRYFVNTMGQSGEYFDYEIKYTFGHYPLQQYLIELEDGFIQALNITWDSRSEAEGGQRWYHLREDEDITPEHPFFWDRHFQNWNTRCSDCHSTNIVKNYSPDNHSFNTTWSEINVSCEACHGPGQAHVELARSESLSDSNTGFAQNKEALVPWIFEPGAPTAKPQGKKSQREINMCASCHSLGTQLQEGHSLGDFHDAKRIQLVSEGPYFADGQILEEVFVMGSFLQSKMHEAGVTCTNCHEPHSGKVKTLSNALCYQCHTPEAFGTPDHHYHPIDSEGASCVNCHMPERTYMGVDARRDHSFTIPNPTLSAQLGVPNACVQCHENDAPEDKQPRDNQWAIDAMKQWEKQPPKIPWASHLRSAQRGDVLVTRALAQSINEDQLPAFTRASLLQQFAAIPSRVSVELAQSKLKDSNPLIRRAAVSSLQALPPITRWQTLSPHLDDPSKSVRFEIAENLADVLPQLPIDQRSELQSLIDEYRVSLTFSHSSPGTQLAIASLETRLGNSAAALTAYQRALRIEPNYVPALINLADYYRNANEDSKSESLFKRALKVAPDSGAAQHSYGLFLVRKKEYETALKHLKLATEQDDAQAHFAYVYAIALDSQGETDQAIEALISADMKWPNQYDLLMTLIGFLEKTNDRDSLLRYLSNVSAIAPASPDVKRLINRYSE